MSPCNNRFKQLSAHLGGINCHAPNPFVYVRNPLHLQNASLNVVELLMITGAAMALVHAWVWYRRKGDPTNLGLWFAAVAYVLVAEPPVYFPDHFGLGGLFQVVFIHNEFTVGFLFNRLPLYIVALYPAMVYFAYMLVQRAGIFERRGALVGAVCVGFVHHAFYEIFDHLGPQYRWWLWDYNNSFSRLRLASVPLLSLVGFSMLGAFGFTLWSRRVLVRHSGAGTPLRHALARGVASGALVAGSGLLSIELMNVTFADQPLVAVANYATVAVFAAVTLSAFRPAFRSAFRSTFRSAFRSGRGSGPSVSGFLDSYGAVFGAVYLTVFAGLWLAALSDYLHAANGRTIHGGPVGSLPYVLACFAAAAYMLRAAYCYQPDSTHRASAERGEPLRHNRRAATREAR